MDELVLNATRRTETGKGPNRRLRAQGMAPAVIYGGNKEPLSVILNQRELQRTVHAKSTHPILDLRLEGEEGAEKVMLRELHRNPLNRKILHADLIRIQADHELQTTVEVVGLGQPRGVREGGMLERSIRELEIRCLPGNLPELFEVNIADLGINDSIRAGDLSLGEGVQLMTDPETVLFHVAPVKAVAAEAEAEGEAESDTAQPEVIGRKKEAEEEEQK